MLTKVQLHFPLVQIMELLLHTLACAGVQQMEKRVCEHMRSERIGVLVVKCKGRLLYCKYTDIQTLYISLYVPI